MRATVFGLLMALLLQTSALAEDASETLLPYAIHVHRTPVQSWTGYGIYLGGGTFITAAHVVGRAWMTRPKVVIGGIEYPTQVIKEGSFEGTDITLLSVEQGLLPMRLLLRKMSLCRPPPFPGQQVVTVIPEGIAHSQILDTMRLPAGARRFNTVIADVARTGNSGSGVFDLRQRCLLGIMSRKITAPENRGNARQRKDVAKYFVPAADIADFLPAALRSKF